MPSNTLQFDHTIQAVFSVCASPDIAEAAAAACEGLVGSSFVGEFHEYFNGERRPQFAPSLKSASSSVALVDCDPDPELALETMERLRSVSLKNLSIVAFSSKVDANYLLRAMRAGCNEFLHKPASAPALSEALQRFLSAGLADLAGHRRSGRVLCFYGAKGGVGTTTLAVHLASNLVRRHQKRTLLIDHHHELGHIALYLGLEVSPYHFDKLIDNVDRLDADLLEGFVVKHSSGLEVLASPDGCAPDHTSGAEEVQLVLNFLRTQYDYIIIDSSMTYNDLIPPILRASNEVILVSTPDVASLRDLSRRVEHLSLLESSTTKLRIVINRSTSDDAVTGEQIEAALRFPVWTAIPNNYAELLRSINSGEPISPQNRSPFAQQINKWTDKLVSASAVEAESAGIVKKRFGFWPTRREKLA